MNQLILVQQSSTEKWSEIQYFLFKNLKISSYFIEPYIFIASSPSSVSDSGLHKKSYDFLSHLNS